MGYYRHLPLGEISSDSDSNDDSSSQDIDYGLISRSPGVGKREICYPMSLLYVVVVCLDSLFVTNKRVSFFRSKVDISYTIWEAEVIVEPCRLGEKVCLQCPQGVKMEMFHMYSFVFEDIGFKFPFTNFECDFLKALHHNFIQTVVRSCAVSRSCAKAWGFANVFKIGPEVKPL